MKRPVIRYCKVMKYAGMERFVIYGGTNSRTENRIFIFVKFVCNYSMASFKCWQGHVNEITEHILNSSI